MAKTKFAYLRPLFQEQSSTKQVCNFIELGVDKKNIFSDEKYGEFSEYEKLKSIMSQGDTLYIKSLRVLGTDTIQMIDEWNKLRKNSKINVNVLETYMMDIGSDRDNIESEQLVKSILNFEAII